MTDALRPLTIGELLDRTFALYRRHFVLFVGIAAVPALFNLAVQLFFAIIDPAGMGILLTLIGVLAWGFIALASAALSQAATVVAVSQLHLGRETTIAESFGAIRPRLGELMVLILNLGVRIGIGFLLLIVPGIILALMYSLAIPVAVLEERGVSESLARSRELTEGHRGRIFLIYFLLILLVTIVSLVWQVPATIAASIMERVMPADQAAMLRQVTLQAGSFLTQTILGPIATIALALVYYDERVRKEAFDLEHMMQQLDQAAPGGPPAT